MTAQVEQITKQELHERWDSYHWAFNRWQECRTDANEQIAQERLAEACEAQAEYDRQYEEWVTQ